MKLSFGEAQAVGICLLTRIVGAPRGIVGGLHPELCGWDDYPKDKLLEWLGEFNGRNEGGDRAMEKAFRSKSPSAQRLLIRAAQGYVAKS